MVILFYMSIVYAIYLFFSIRNGIFSLSPFYLVTSIYLLAMLIYFIVRIVKKRRVVETFQFIFLTHLALIVIFFSVIIVPPSSRTTRSIYPVQIAHIKDKGYNTSIFPEVLPETATDINYNFFPSILQGGGHTYLYYNLPAEEIASIKTSISSDTILPVFTYNDYKNGTYAFDIDSRISEIVTGNGNKYSEKLYSNTLELPNIIDEHPNSEIYLIDSNMYPHRAHGECIVIDSENNFIIYSAW